MTTSLPKTVAIVKDAIEDLKGFDVSVIDVREKTTVTDFMVIATGTSSRHTKAISVNVANELKAAGLPPMGQEGDVTGEWVLIDANEVLVHVMLQDIRDFYNLEKLWQPDEAQGAEATN